MAIVMATVHDIGDLMRLYHQLSENYEDDPDAVRDAIQYGPTTIYLFVDGKRTIGTATMSIRAVPSFGKISYVDDVVVDEDAQCGGVATALMRHIEKRARQRGCRAVELTSRPEREAANRLYEKLGYRLRDTNKFFRRLDEE